MKSLSLSRPLIIMMVGYPGAGKSFFARQFSDAFNAPLVSVDQMRTDIFDEPTYLKDEDQLIDKLVTAQALELTKTNKTFIIDGGCNTKVARQVFQKLAQSKGYGALTIWVQTDVPTCRIRATKRSQKRAGDTYNKSISPDILASIAKRFTQPTHTEPTIVISGKHTFAAQLRVVLKKLVPARESTESTAYSQSSTQRPYGDIPPKSRRLTIN